MSLITQSDSRILSSHCTDEVAEVLTDDFVHNYTDSKCGLWTNSISLTWEFVGNAESQPPDWAYESESAF